MVFDLHAAMLSRGYYIEFSTLNVRGGASPLARGNNDDFGDFSPPFSRNKRHSVNYATYFSRPQEAGRFSERRRRTAGVT